MRRPRRGYSPARHRRLNSPQVVERSRSCHIAAAKVHMGIAVYAVATGFGDDVHDEAAGLAVFGRVIVGEDLELLHFVYGSAGAVATGHQLVGDVGAVNVPQVAAGIDGAGTDKVAAHS